MLVSGWNYESGAFAPGDSAFSRFKFPDPARENRSCHLPARCVSLPTFFTALSGVAKEENGLKSVFV
jgi:hypothetical protein